MESITEALNQIDEVLKGVRDFLSEVKDKERFITKLTAKINTLDVKRSELEASLTKREADFVKELAKKQDESMEDGQKKAEIKAKSIVDAARAENSGLISKNESLKGQISALEGDFSNKSVKINSEIKELEGRRIDLMKEIALLTSTRDEFQKQISSMKEKVSVFLA